MCEKVKINFKDNNVRPTDGSDGLKNYTDKVADKQLQIDMH